MRTLAKTSALIVAMLTILSTILALPATATSPTIAGDCDSWVISGPPGAILDANDPAVSGRVPGTFVSPYDGSNGRLVVVIMFDGNTAASEHVAFREPDCLPTTTVPPTTTTEVPPSSTTTTTTTTTVPVTTTTTTLPTTTTTVTIPSTTTTVTTVPPSTTTTTVTPTTSIPPSSTTVPPTVPPTSSTVPPITTTTTVQPPDTVPPPTEPPDGKCVEDPDSRTGWSIRGTDAECSPVTGFSAIEVSLAGIGFLLLGGVLLWLEKREKNLA